MGLPLRRLQSLAVPSDAELGEAVQVGPIKSKLKPPGIKRLKLKYGEPLSSFDFKIKLRRYSSGVTIPAGFTLEILDFKWMVGRLRSH
jgi:hypothetical protein